MIKPPTADDLVKDYGITKEQAEIIIQDNERLQKAMMNAYNDTFFPVTVRLPDAIEFMNININASIDGSKCEHSWLTYQGFSESYDYCKRCDAKRGQK